MPSRAYWRGREGAVRKALLAVSAPRNLARDREHCSQPCRVPVIGFEFAGTANLALASRLLSADSPGVERQHPGRVPPASYREYHRWLLQGRQIREGHARIRAVRDCARL